MIDDKDRYNTNNEFKSTNQNRIETKKEKRATKQLLNKFVHEECDEDSFEETFEKINKHKS